MKSKILSIQELAQVLKELKKTKKIVHCHGVFDLLHIGHIKHFEKAKKYGDILVVSITPDRYVNKGPSRPAFNEKLRSEAIAALEAVDYVCINEWPTGVEIIGLLRPDFYVKGADYIRKENDLTGKITEEEEAVNSVGGKLVFTETVSFSSSKLINTYFSSYSDEANGFIGKLKQKYSISGICGYFEEIKSVKALVIGEAIIDEYVYCEALGKSSKEPIIAVKQVSSERFAGGILSLANNVSNFADNAELVTFAGDQDNMDEYIRKSLNPGIRANILKKSNSPTIVKKRYLESYLLQKLFEVYEINEKELSEEDNDRFYSILEEKLETSDIVIVADYGHGMINDRIVRLLSKKAKFLSVNTQSNAGNRGFNTISKYYRADFLCLSYPELLLETRNRMTSIHDMITYVSEKLNCGRMIITRGYYGSICYDKDSGFYEVPSFTNKVIDRVGAGDALFSISSLCAYKNMPMELTGFIGNVVGAEAVLTLGHQKNIETTPLIKHIETILK
ncbi:MAG: adenylyltransferase/cytidyltransferase family protein [Ignavibacteria bacterium]|jgi:rfaE bifunctional protein kinase chain/domain/rfaE bifunctional protein nucleotidyltransferase chain/domain|nr:adenylyltransferase/cytidyltransferase family protein [Ignavibacteria bacterium]MCU7502549.1 adenylyltransferase/cytidyltransferase family protein [Ignavibacteria bacterium]MCU7515248.1 adenylyltransferase/cytidyltransferase family protein [Ignavibacteria bacterium]